MVLEANNSEQLARSRYSLNLISTEVYRARNALHDHSARRRLFCIMTRLTVQIDTLRTLNAKYQEQRHEKIFDSLATGIWGWRSYPRSSQCISMKRTVSMHSIIRHENMLAGPWRSLWLSLSSLQEVNEHIFPFQTYYRLNSYHYSKIPKHWSVADKRATSRRTFG